MFVLDLVLHLTASAALTAMSSLKISKDCYSKGTTQGPGESCNDILEEERQRCEEEKGGKNCVLS